MIDTHAHPYLCKLPVDTLMENARLAGVTQVITVATSIPVAKENLALKPRFPNMSFTVGIHPCESAEAQELDQLEALARSGAFCAIGEIGLDFYRNYAPREVQFRVFEAQLQVARKTGLPIVIHSRQADPEMCEFLPAFTDIPKVFHCFSSGLDFVKKIDNENIRYSFTGIITYGNKPELEEVVRHLPLEKVMIETDCPYLTPQVYKGKENQPAYVSEVAKAIAQIKGLSIDTVIAETTKTAKTFFKI